MNATLKQMPQDEMSVEKPKGGSPFVLVGPANSVNVCCRYDERGWEWFCLTMTYREIPLNRDEVDVISMANVEAFAREVYEEWDRFEHEQEVCEPDSWEEFRCQR